MKLRLLGTGASGGTPGEGRSRRLESSLLAECGRTRLLIDVTRHFREQAAEMPRLDAVLLTHAHRDAAGGIAQLRRWWRSRASEPLPLYAAEQTIRVVEARYKRLDHCSPAAVAAGDERSVGALTVTALEVPHAHDPRFPTFAWRLSAGKAAVYASDVSELTPQLERFSRGAGVLVIDGAMWGRRIFSHLTVDKALPRLCDWKVERIVLTQIGKTCPPHGELEREVRRLCRRARPGYDGMEVRL